MVQSKAYSWKTWGLKTKLINTGSHYNPVIKDCQVGLMERDFLFGKWYLNCNGVPRGKNAIHWEHTWGLERGLTSVA